MYTDILLFSNKCCIFINLYLYVFVSVHTLYCLSKQKTPQDTKNTSDVPSPEAKPYI